MSERRRRIGSMTLCWSSLGALSGASIGLEGGWIGAVSFFLAGAIQFAIVGAVVGLIGGRPKEVLLGGLIGSAAGLILGGPSLAEAASFGMFFGAIVGSTWRLYLYLPMRLSSRLVALGRGRAVPMTSIKSG